jgi:excisionase family DNA binding protein
MAGKFLSLEEAARHLGVSVDDVNRLVDRKKLFPMRDGTSVKFKLDDLDRVKSDLSDESAGSSDLGLGLELSSPNLAGSGPAASGGGGGDDILLGDAIEETESIFGTDDADPRSPSQTIVRGGQPAGGEDDLVFDDRGSLLASDDLALESIIGASSPSLMRGGQPTIGLAGSGSGSGTLSIDLSGIGSGGPGSGTAALAGPALSGAMDSGLSLEDGGLQASGIDIGGASIIGSGVDAVGGSLVGDAFELGAGGDDEESASVVIATEDTGDSSFFGAVAEDSASVSFEDSTSLGGAVVGDEGFVEAAVGPPFNALQIVGLVCCTLFLLACGLVMVDLVSVIAAPAGKPVAGPLIKALADTFAWR